MKKFRRTGLLGLAMLLGTGPLWALGVFEGEVDMQMTSTGSNKTIPMQYFVKGEKIRVNVESEDNKFSGSSIMDMKTLEMVFLMDKQKMYMVSQIHPEKMTSRNQDRHFSIHDSGNSENIAGYNCEEWDWTSDDGNGKVWFAKGIGNWWSSVMLAQKNLTPAQKAMAQLVADQKMFPLKYQMMDKSGKTTHTMEATKVEKKPLSSDMFVPPSDYKKFDMGNMFGGATANSSNSPSSGNQDPLSNVKPKLPF